MGHGTAARAAATVIAARILCSYCILLANSLMSNRPVVASAITESQITGFRPVEYPSSGEIWDYYRFQNDYGNELKTKAECTKSYPMSGGYVKKRRKQDMIAELKTSTDADHERDPAPQPYCIRKSGFFPEMEYPLSATDLWMPVYWNRHLGTEDTLDTNNIKPKISENNNHVTTSLNYITNKDPEKNKMRLDSACNRNAKQAEIMRRNDTSPVSIATEMISSTETTESLPMPLQTTFTLEACVSNDLYDQSYPTTVPMDPNHDLRNNTSETISDLTYSNVTSSSPLECLSPKFASLYNETRENSILSTADTSTGDVKSTAPSPSLSVSSLPDETSRILSNTECNPSAISSGMTSQSACPDSVSDENSAFNSNDSCITCGSFPEYCDEFIILVDNSNFNDPIVNCSILDLTSDPAILSECNKATSDKSPITRLSPDSLCRYFDNINNFIDVDKAKSVMNSFIESDIDKKTLCSVKYSDKVNEFEEVIPTLEYSDDKCEFCTESPYEYDC